MTDKSALGPAGIVVAAGGSSRLGVPKQLVRVDGETLLRRTVRLAGEAGCDPVVVVLRSGAEDLVRELEGLPASLAINSEWQTGMASSVRCGLRSALDVSSDLTGVMVLVCDQPRLNLPLLRALLATHHSQPGVIAASRYREIHGVPALFSRAMFPELMGLTGDQGARVLLERHREAIASVDFAGGDFDIDTPADLARLGSEQG